MVLILTKVLKLKRRVYDGTDEIVDILPIFEFTKRGNICYYRSFEVGGYRHSNYCTAKFMVHQTRILIDYQISFLTLRNIGYWCQ